MQFSLNILKRLFGKLFSTSAAGLYMILFAFFIGLATFVENDFGTSAAQKLIFKAWWFELLLALFGITLIVNIVRFRMVQQRKWAVLMFHAAIIIILLGAWVTRYYGYEGMMHIREESQTSYFLSSEMHLCFEGEIKGSRYAFEEPVLFASKGNNHFKEQYQLGTDIVEVELIDFMPNPVERIIEDPSNGMPVIQIVFGGANGREEYYLKYGRSMSLYGTVFNFGEEIIPDAFNIKLEDGVLMGYTFRDYMQTIMATQSTDTIRAGMPFPLQLRSLYASGSSSFVFGQYTDKGRIEIASSDIKMASNSTAGLRIRVTSAGKVEEQWIYGVPGVEGKKVPFAIPSGRLWIGYGPKRVQLPFALYLNDFILEKYPGTDNASSYASEVTLIDERNNLREPNRIYMNNILNYGGYRFFQSSFDQDELGTYLSVNHDAPGTLISYIGYFFLTLGMLLTFFIPGSRFRKLVENVKRLRVSRNTLLLVLGLCMAFPGFGQSVVTPSVVAREHTEIINEVIVQDHNGRMKPFQTLAEEVVRKLSREKTVLGFSASQVFLSMSAQPKDWYHIPLIKLGKHEEIRNILGVSEDLVAYADFFNQDGSYKLRDYTRNAYEMPSRDRSVFEKELIKIDERVNICSMIFSGHLFRVFPLPGDPNNHWATPSEIMRAKGNSQDFDAVFYGNYLAGISRSKTSGNWQEPNQLVAALIAHQKQYGANILPSNLQVNTEMMLNRLNIFNRLSLIYGLLTVLFLGMFFTNVFKPALAMNKWIKIAGYMMMAAFAFHTLGLGMRWYVSERAPWSNGYESMIYIGWTTVLAGLLFSRKSIGGLTATAALAATIMSVAGMSWLDPEITPLVPVLKSYWLTIHVSLEAGSYGFLMLGAIIGVLNLILMIFISPRNKERVDLMIKELTYSSEITLLAGLFMISIGTYLGGVWANESWGRYWGWDAKETWALVTILVYSFILHMRFIPGLRGLYAFNVATLFGWFSVLMTYFGVNYYLSGLHSYAAGDPVPVPSFVYYVVSILIVISLTALVRYRKVSV
jgi:cytochrome c-type biogenesis protein CcsB